MTWCRNIGRVMVVGVVAALWSGCPVTMKGPGVGPGEIGHPESGIRFPETVQGFSRGDIREYGEEGRNLSIGYNSLNGVQPEWITFYVYPGPPMRAWGSSEDSVRVMVKRLVDGHFEQVQREIVAAHPEAELVSETDRELAFMGRDLVGRTALYRIQMRVGYFGRRPMLSRAEVYSFGEWMLKLRYTYAPSDVENPEAGLKRFKDALRAVNP